MLTAFIWPDLAQILKNDALPLGFDPSTFESRIKCATKRAMNVVHAENATVNLILKDSEKCCVILENFGGKLQDFLFVIEYLFRSQNVKMRDCEKLISQVCNFFQFLESCKNVKLLTFQSKYFCPYLF